MLIWMAYDYIGLIGTSFFILILLYEQAVGNLSIICRYPATVAFMGRLSFVGPHDER